MGEKTIESGVIAAFDVDLSFQCENFKATSEQFRVVCKRLGVVIISEDDNPGPAKLSGRMTVQFEVSATDNLMAEQEFRSRLQLLLGMAAYDIDGIVWWSNWHRA